MRRDDGYRADEEMYVYDQCCDNCENYECPLMLPETEEEYQAMYGTLEGFDKEAAEERYEEAMRCREEDGIIRDEEPVWCIYWRGRVHR